MNDNRMIQQVKLTFLFAKKADGLSLIKVLE